MWNLTREVSKAIEVVGAEADILTIENSSELWRRVAIDYAGGSMDWPMWDHLRDYSGIQIPGLLNGLDELAEFLGSAPAVLMFEPSDEKQYFQFAHASDIPRVLKECHRFEFYITDETLTFLLCINHHDILVGAGSARDWVCDLSDRLPN